MSMMWVGLPIGFLALCAIVGAAFDGDWLLNHPRMERLVDELGREGARFACLLVGGMVFVISLMVMFGR